MARNSARLKLGYFPLQTDLANGIRARLKFPSHRFVAFDPCCGTGTALFSITHGSQCTRFGIEVDRVRAQAAEYTLSNVHYGDFETAEFSGECQLLFLNPPYDQEVGSRLRVEESFLERGAKTLAPGGVLILAVPFRVLTGLLKILFHQFHSIRIVRGDPVFSQIIIFAVRMGERDLMDQQSYHLAHQVSQGFWEAVPDLSDGEWTYTVPEPSPDRGFGIRKQVVRDEDVIQVLVSSTVLKSLADSPLGRPPVEDRPLRILHPLTEGMTALLLLAGYFDGMIFDRDDPRCSVVKGSTAIHRICREDETEKGTEITQIDAPVSRVTVAHLGSRTVTDLLPDSMTVFCEETDATLNASLPDGKG